MDTEKKRQQEQAVLEEIIRCYCHGHHHRRAAGEALCADCRELASYAAARVRACPRMASKSFCSICPVHCYTPERHAQIQRVMRYGGPRLLFRHPIMTLRHIYLSWKEKRKSSPAAAAAPQK